MTVTPGSCIAWWQPKLQERVEHIKKLRAGWAEWWAQLTDEERAEAIRSLHAGRAEWWAQLAPEGRVELGSKIAAAACATLTPETRALPQSAETNRVIRILQREGQAAQTLATIYGSQRPSGVPRTVSSAVPASRTDVRPTYFNNTEQPQFDHDRALESCTATVLHLQ